MQRQPPAPPTKEMQNLFKKSAPKAGTAAAISLEDRESIQTYKSKAMVAFSLKKYEDAENLYMNALNIIESLPGVGSSSATDSSISAEAVAKLRSNIDECRVKRGLRPLGEPEDEEW